MLLSIIFFAVFAAISPQLTAARPPHGASTASSSHGGLKNTARRIPKGIKPPSSFPSVIVEPPTSFPSVIVDPPSATQTRTKSKSNGVVTVRPSTLSTSTTKHHPGHPHPPPSSSSPNSRSASVFTLYPGPHTLSPRPPFTRPISTHTHRSATTTHTEYKGVQDPITKGPAAEPTLAERQFKPKPTVKPPKPETHRYEEPWSSPVVKWSWLAHFFAAPTSSHPSEGSYGQPTLTHPPSSGDPPATTSGDVKSTSTPPRTHVLKLSEFPSHTSHSRKPTSTSSHTSSTRLAPGTHPHPPAGRSAGVEKRSAATSKPKHPTTGTSTPPRITAVYTKTRLF